MAKKWGNFRFFHKIVDQGNFFVHECLVFKETIDFYKKKCGFLQPNVITGE